MEARKERSRTAPEGEGWEQEAMEGASWTLAGEQESLGRSVRGAGGRSWGEPGVAAQDFRPHPKRKWTLPGFDGTGENPDDIGTMDREDSQLKGHEKIG